MAGAMSEAELAELEALVSGGAEIPLRLEQDRTGRAWVEPDPAARKAYRAVPRLLAEVRRLRARVGELEAAQARAARPPAATAPREPGGREEGGAGEELGSLMSAAFRVSPRAATAARDDPLAALAVQVARALSPDAGELERARLIAMAFAASEGDLEAFWQARRQRSLARLADRKG